MSEFSASPGRSTQIGLLIQVYTPFVSRYYLNYGPDIEKLLDSTLSKTFLRVN